MSLLSLNLLLNVQVTSNYVTVDAIIEFQLLAGYNLSSCKIVKIPYQYNAELNCSSSFVTGQLEFG